MQYFQAAIFTLDDRIEVLWDAIHLLVVLVEEELLTKKLSICLLQSLAALLGSNDLNWGFGFLEHFELMPPGIQCRVNSNISSKYWII